ncbi:RNA cytosine C(5)-methyltransferase NSUN2-like isoform X1 [Vespa mandarinia]|uniref:RNA cytosine C(5)-methyltransferase NSUN2-like isoform X1 n=1 Tax=Vespa mandarinia TaxID=7446 RepID=UPI0016210C41|nr:RNA cytosine C(5)-methyltransferase NSUN2-like isoform X1 [Vespa mandarinia]XP_035719127.1 RNA cytosine C(5)-methyltransferase NSUN2-like isoform X1 [Vespa mandarinia]XP_035719128.1 RNA cytosine C(5)-methyltransferase NSUN2-like isoform X1 [Vespa mandarinia]
MFQTRFNHCHLKMAFLIKWLKVEELLKIFVRFKHGSNHWSVIRKEKTHKNRALAYFDDFYDKVYGKAWKDIRTALLQEENKYIAVVNNFSDVKRIQTSLENSGAINLKLIYDAFMENVQDQRFQKKPKKTIKLNDRMDNIISERQISKVQSVYPIDYESSPDSLTYTENNDRNININKPLELVHLKSIAEDSNDVNIDSNRIVLPSDGLASLYEFVPVTKLKGMDEWVLESEHYEYYQKTSDFKIPVEKEKILSFPKHLKLYTYEEFSEEKFSVPQKGSTGVLDYYLFDGGSILPILALDIQLGDYVLDMCAAPGGKTLTILQTLMPNLVVANDLSQSRVNRIKKVLNQYIADIGQLNDKLFITEEDARKINDKGVYNKILVDVPCTTDRHVLHENNNNIFKPTRIKERLRMPEIQADILFNALQLVTVGGTVVYSTCSLSPIQNDGVIQMALKRMWEESNTVIIVKDMSDALDPLQTLFNFGNFGLKHGHIVIPTIGYNWGPMYFCKMVKLK